MTIYLSKMFVVPDRYASIINLMKAQQRMLYLVVQSYCRYCDSFVLIVQFLLDLKTAGMQILPPHIPENGRG